jgi:hypothetical protein
MDEFASPAVADRAAGVPLRIGLLVEGLTSSRYVYDFARWLQSQQNMAATLLVLPHAEVLARPPSARSRASSTRDEPARHAAASALHLLQWFERFLIARSVHHAAHFEKCDLSAIINDTVALAPFSRTPDGAFRLAAADTRRLDALGLDLIVSFASRLLPGEIAAAARLGVVSPCPLDDRTPRPPGFWEVYHRRNTTPFTIQHLAKGVDQADVLLRGSFGTHYYYSLNQAVLYRKSYHHLESILAAIASTGTLPHPLPKFPYSGPSFREPGLREVVVYAAQLGWTLLRKAMRRLLGIQYRWNVAYVLRNWRDADYRKAIRLKNEPGHFLADPFVITRNGRSCCFVEDYDYRTRRGSIAVFELTSAGGKRLGTALDEPFHLSFPYLFEYQGTLYMCPETSANRDIRVYKCLEFPLRWQLERVLMQNVSAADTMLFEKDGKWWMFTNIDPLEIGDHCSELFIFSADSPLATDWRPHALNPVVVDASRARNAGMVIEGSECFRMSQGQGFDLYGKHVLINNIRELTETTYREFCGSIAIPSFTTGALGTHHLHTNARFTVFDFVTSSRMSWGGIPLWSGWACSWAHTCRSKR